MENLNSQVGVVIEIRDLERQVMNLASKGFSLAEITQETGLSTRAVKKLLENMSRKIKSATANEKETIKENT